MTTYAYPNTKTKKALKELLLQGEKIEVVELTPFGSRRVNEGAVVISGPHAPLPHKWYGSGVVENGLLTKLT